MKENIDRNKPNVATLPYNVSSGRNTISLQHANQSKNRTQHVLHDKEQEEAANRYLPTFIRELKAHIEMIMSQQEGPLVIVDSAQKEFTISNPSMINQLFSIPPFQQEQHESDIPLQQPPSIKQAAIPMNNNSIGSNSNNNNYTRINVDSFALDEMCKLSERFKQLEKELKAKTQSYNSLYSLFCQFQDDVRKQIRK